MTDQFTNEPLLDMFLFETAQLLEQLEQAILSYEKECSYTKEAINEIFRIMHTIKGSSAMMMFQNISTLAHAIEDLFFYLREEKTDVDHSLLSDFILESIDFIKNELEKIKAGQLADGDAAALIGSLKEYLAYLKQEGSGRESLPEQNNTAAEKQQYYISQLKSEARIYQYIYKAVIYFEEGCEMENMRAFTVVHNLKDITEEVYYLPEDLMDNDECIESIKQEGFKVYFKADLESPKVHELLMQTIFLKELELTCLEDDSEIKRFLKPKAGNTAENPVKIPNITDMPSAERNISQRENYVSSAPQSIISVSVAKLDKLMDLVGEMVIAEAMVIQNPDIKGLILDNFNKAARQLSKITGEIQDTVMSIRMVPLSATFHKMNRIVRDMSKKLDKEIKLVILGEETEVDKNIIEHISDPLMHLVRNSIDHGIETKEERAAKGKPKEGTLTLEAKNAGSDVIVIVKDDGVGLHKEKILIKAKENNLLYKEAGDMTDREIYNLILLPGFSTKDDVTEFSGRGVGMDVVMRNVETVGGSLIVDSTPGEGSTFSLKIPLTLAIIDGMNVKVGNSFYTIPTISIKESFRPKERDIITDPDGNEMIMVRGQCYPILRLHRQYHVKTEVTDFCSGIIIMVEQEEKTLCIFADELLGQQQVVVKSLPEYIQRFKKVKGLGGCTLLGDGSISLILDIATLIN